MHVIPNALLVTTNIIMFVICFMLGREVAKVHRLEKRVKEHEKKVAAAIEANIRAQIPTVL